MNRGFIKAVKPLINQLEDEHKKVWCTVERALVKITKKNFGQDQGKWREKPESPGQSPDLVYIVNVIPDKGVNKHGS